MKKLSFIFLTILFIISCKSGDSKKLVTINNKYSISLPPFLVKASITLNEVASLQYLNAWKEFYVIVIDESKFEFNQALIENNFNSVYSNDINGYSRLILNLFEQNIAISRKSEITDTLINNMPAKLLTISGRVEGMDAFYSLAFIQGKERYYQVIAWTLSSKEYKYKDEMKKIIYSFKEL